MISNYQKYKCPHGRQKCRCRQCGGIQFCIHDRLKHQCRECEPLKHLANVIRNRTQRSLKGYSTLIHIPTISKYIGCSVEEFKSHIEKQFINGMSWDNYGTKWNIDHCIPLLYNKPTMDELLKRFHYSNCQPLHVIENIKKGNRFISYQR